MGTDLRPGPGVLVCTFFWDVCVSFLVWAGPVEGLELSLLKKNILQLFLNFRFVIVGRQHCHNLKRSRPVFAPLKHKNSSPFTASLRFFPSKEKLLVCGGGMAIMVIGTEVLKLSQ